MNIVRLDISYLSLLRKASHLDTERSRSMQQAEIKDTERSRSMQQAEIKDTERSRSVLNSLNMTCWSGLILGNYM